MADEKKAFPTQAEAAAAIAELRRHAHCLEIACNVFDVPSTASLWLFLDEHNKLKYAGSIETRRVLDTLLSRTWLICGGDILRIHGKRITVIDVAPKFYEAEKDWLAWVESLTADEYERFKSIVENVGAEMVLAAQARASTALANRIKKPPTA